MTYHEPQPEEVPERRVFFNMFTLPLAMGIYAQAVSGEDSTLLDKAVFVAMPFALEASAVTGASAGAKEWERRQSQNP